MTLWALDDPTLMANNDPVPVMPGSIRWDDGEPETTTRAASTGGGNVQMVISQDVTDKLGMLYFDMPNDIQSAENARGWKKNPGKNVFEINATINGQSFSRIFTTAVVKNRVENQASSDGVISLEISSDAT